MISQCTSGGLTASDNGLLTCGFVAGGCDIIGLILGGGHLQSERPVLLFTTRTGPRKDLHVVRECLRSIEFLAGQRPAIMISVVVAMFVRTYNVTKKLVFD